MYSQEIERKISKYILRKCAEKKNFFCFRGGEKNSERKLDWNGAETIIKSSKT
jgi:hypothetical protein